MNFRLIFLLPLLAACGQKPAATTTARISADSLVRPYPASDFQLRIPARWAGLSRLDTLSTQERGDARVGAIQYSYVPQDPKTHTEVLVAVAVYDSATWHAALKEGGPPPGDSVAGARGLVYIVALPQSNPFGGGADSTAFASLELSSAEAARFVVPDSMEKM